MTDTADDPPFSKPRPAGNAQTATATAAPGETLQRPLTLANLKDHYGLNDTSEDARINDLILTANDIADSYCNRFFRYESNWSETFDRYTMRPGLDVTLQLQRLPVAAGQWSVSDGTGSDISFFARLDERTGRMTIQSLRQRPVTVTYTGGYAPEELPGPVNQALWLLFDDLWHQAGANGGQRVSRITVPDVGTLAYDNGGGYGLVWQSLLRPYRIEGC